MKKILIYSIGVIVLLYFVEQIFQMPYMIKTLIKLPLFIIIPWLYLRPIKLKMTKQHTKEMLLISTGIVLIIITAYFILKNFINVDSIRSDMENRMQLNNFSMITAGLYTIFINAFVEEVFFRGLLYQRLQQSTRYATWISASLFAIYHVAIFKTWFSLPLTLFILFALIVGGLIFNFFVKRTNSLLASYCIHVAADLAIILIGFSILGFFA